MDEIILVARRSAVFEDEALAFQGTQSDSEAVARVMKNLAANIETMRRGDAEENAAYKQPIPYVIIRKGSDIFTYARLSGGGEARLHDKLSIGAGGHMNEIEGSADFEATLQENLERELSEELNIASSEKRLIPVGLINDDANEVGKVHIGILVVLELLSEDASVAVNETDQLAGSWKTLGELNRPEIFEKLESWSQIAVKALSPDEKAAPKRSVRA